MVQDGNAAREAIIHHANRLRGQRDLGYQVNGLLTLRHRMGDGAQVHLGLAAPGYTVQQKTARQEARIVQRGGTMLTRASD